MTGFTVSSDYLAASRIIDCHHPAVLAKAAELVDGATHDRERARRCFESVRDDIRHRWDFRLNPVTCSASEVLRHGTGYCYAKSHLLAALLRASGIAAGLCYQRLSVDGGGASFCLHGLNAVFLRDFGWYRIDARGNKTGVDAQFMPRVALGVRAGRTRRGRSAGHRRRAAAAGGGRADALCDGAAGLSAAAGPEALVPADFFALLPAYGHPLP